MRLRCVSASGLVDGTVQTDHDSRVTSGAVRYLILFVVSGFVSVCALIVHKAADQEFQAERDKATEADALAQVFQISGDLVNSRLLISQVCKSYLLPLSAATKVFFTFVVAKNAPCVVATGSAPSIHTAAGTSNY